MGAQTLLFGYRKGLKGYHKVAINYVSCFM